VNKQQKVIQRRFRLVNQLLTEIPSHFSKSGGTWPAGIVSGLGSRLRMSAARTSEQRARGPLPQVGDRSRRRARCRGLLGFSLVEKST
jgi:hypothetical protein